MEQPAKLTPTDAPLLCLVCTASACGSLLIATINVTLGTTLAEVRSVLTSLAAGGDGGPAAVRAPPSNVTAQQANAILASPLHPFDFTETFSFVHGGCCRAFTRAQESALCLEEALPRYPRFGVPPACLPGTASAPGSGSAAAANTAPNAASSGALTSSTAAAMVANSGPLAPRRRVCASSCTRWLPDAAPPLAVVAHPRQPRQRRRASALSEPTPQQRRYALAALFVAPGDRAEGGLRVERVVAERLQLQLPDPRRPSGVAGGGLFQPVALGAHYGRPFRVETWCATVTRWNGNTEDLLGRTLLHEATQVGNEAATRFLLAQPYIAVDAAERQSGSTALHLAVQGNHAAVVRMLLEEGGANPLLANRVGDTPLHVALLRRRAVLVGLMCARLRTLQVPSSALQDEGLRNATGHTPAALFRLFSPSLADLCRDGASLAAVKALVQHYFFSADAITARDAICGQSVLHAAAAGASVDVVRYLAEELGLAALFAAPPSPSSADGGGALLYDFRRQTPLHVAAASGAPACVQYLLTQLPAFCLTEPDVNGCTPLLLALKSRRWRVVELLLAQCPPGSLAAAAQDRAGFTALHFACGLGMTRVVATLLQHHGAVVTQRSTTTTPTPAPPSAAPSPSAVIAADAQWGPHWENTTLVRHSALRGRLRALEERETKRQAQRLHAAAAASPSPPGGIPHATHSGGMGGPLAEDVDAVAAVKAAREYPYGGARRGYTPLRCLLLFASHARRGPGGVPADLLRLLCDYGALSADAIDDVRDLLFFLHRHRADAAAEPLLSHVLERCPAAVLARLQRENALLCRFCAVHDAVGVRWCVEQRLCDVQARAGNPLVACAAANDAAAAAFLLQCAGASVGGVGGGSASELPLAVALRAGHVEVAQVLILSGAPLSTRDGSWSALQQATSSNLESVVRGLLGTAAASSLDVARVLLNTLQGLVYAGPARRTQQSRLALYLARACDPLACDVHVTELLHLSAAVGCYDVTAALVERAMALPTTVWAELLATAPPPPPARPTALVEPTLVPLTIRAPRLLPNPYTGRGGLYRPPKPFQRLVVPTVRRAVAESLLHRVKVRDVYSFAVAAGQLDLVESLRYGLHLPPWSVCDVRGWTVTDYAMTRGGGGRTALVALFVASGIPPARRHGRRLLMGRGDDALLTAVHDAQHQRRKAAAAHQAAVDGLRDEGEAAAAQTRYAAACSLGLVADTLTSLVESNAEGIASRRVPLLRSVLDAFVEAHHIADLRRVPCAWLGRFVVACAAEGRLEVLQLLREHYRVDLAQEWAPGSGAPGSSTLPTPLLAAVHAGHTSVVAYLVKAGVAVHARSCLTAAMAAHVPLKNIQTSTITPLALTASRGDCVMLRLLLAASPPLRPEDTEEEPGRSVGDALGGLVRSARPGVHREAEVALADAVRALATAGHPLRFVGTVRVAAAKGLVAVAQALVECYGGAAVLADLVAGGSSSGGGGTADFSEGEEEEADEGEGATAGVGADVPLRGRRDPLTALAYFAADARLVPTLRALLVERLVDEYQLETWKLTTLAARLQALHAGGRRGARVTAAAVDHALRRGCADGAVLLLALGLVGRGVVPAPRPVRAGSGAIAAPTLSLCLHLKCVLRLWHVRQRQYQSYTPLHAAAELGHGDVVDALTAEMQGLHLPAVDLTSAAAPPPRPTAATVTAPSLYALAATHADGWSWLPCFERIELVVDPRALFVAARDVLALVFSGFGVTQAVDRVCRRAAQHKLLGDVFDVFDSADPLPAASAGQSGALVPGQDQRNGSAAGGPGHAPPATRGCAVSAAFVARQLQRRPSSFFLAGGTYLLTSATSLTCAIAAGSLEWVQYLAVHGLPLVYHRATATRVSTAAERRAAAAAEAAAQRVAVAAGQRRRPWQPREAKRKSGRRARHRRHHCPDGGGAGSRGAGGCGGGAPVPLSGDVCRMDALTLCMAMLAEAHLDRRGGGSVAQTYEDMLVYLLAWPGATPRRETVNMLAIAAASLRRWTLLVAIMQHADRLYAAGLLAGDASQDPAAGKPQPSTAAPPRYFFPLLPEELPPVLAHVIGPNRHVMHAVARHAPKPVLIEVARHCQRSDVEAAADARGCTSVYHALHHRQLTVLETFVALRVPMSQPCRTRPCQTPLMVAAARGRTTAVTALTKPHRVNQRDREGRTSLMLAAAHGHRATVEALLAANADVSLVDSCGRTAVMLAALGGFDDLAKQLVQNFCHAGDLVSSQTSVLHCAAVGGCWRTAAAALKLAVPHDAQLMGGRAEAAALLALREDVDGHTPLHLAHAFGSARVLHELLQVLFHYCGDGGTAHALLARLGSGSSNTDAGGGSVEKRLLLCDSALTRYGWLSGVLEVNAALVEKVRATYADSPAAHGMQPGALLFAPVIPSLRSAESLLRWCVQAGNTVGLRVLADYNVADDCGALHLAAASGAVGVVELLVQLEMSDPSVPDAQTGRYAFEWAALYQHTACAAFLLTNTVLDLTSMLRDYEAAAEEGGGDAVGASAMDDGKWASRFLDGSGDEERTGGAPREAEGAAGLSVPLFHVMAGHCGGQLLVQFVEQALQTAARTFVPPPSAWRGGSGGGSGGGGGASGEQSGAEVLSLALYRALQRPAGLSQLTPLEYAVAVGDPAAVLRTAQVLQRLQETADALRPAQPSLSTAAFASVLAPRPASGAAAAAPSAAWGGGGGAVAAAAAPAPSAGAIYVSRAFLEWVPTLSPAVRTVLFDVLGIWEAASVAGFEAPAAAAESSAPANGGGAASPSRPSHPTATAFRRLRFGDVRLLGLHVLQQDDYCAEVLHGVFSPDHEREVLRLLLQSFPCKIRYEPESYRQCSFAMQTQLLRWLGTSLVLSTYDAPAPCGIPTSSWAATAAAAAAAASPGGVTRVDGVDTIEVQVVQHRGEQYIDLAGTALAHSLYVSTAQHALVVPDVMASLPRTLRGQREAWRAALTALTTRATRLLQRQAHPVLQRSVVVVDWDLLTNPAGDATAAAELTSVTGDVDRYGPVFERVCAALRTFMDWVRGPLHGLLAEVDADDLAAIVVGMRQGGMAGTEVRFRHVGSGRAVTHFPDAATLAVSTALVFQGDTYPSSCIEFNEVACTDVAYTCQATLGRAVAADVALVRVHHARDCFLRGVRDVLGNPRGVVPAAATTTAAAEDAAAPPSPSPTRVATDDTAAAAALNKSHHAGGAAAPSSPPPSPGHELLPFKLELEGATLDAMPLPSLERLLLMETVAAIDAVVSPTPRLPSVRATATSRTTAPARARAEAKSYNAFHSASIVSAALVRRLRSVLVLFTTRRDAMVRLSGDKLMLCFTADTIPSRSEIAAELVRTLVQEESDLYRRRLAEVFEMMEQRLTAYLPQARLTVDVEALQRLAGGEAHVLSALRLLVHQQSEWVLQRLVEGVSIGWDTELGAAVRRHVRQVTLTLDPGPYGTCYLSPDGAFVYYCPLLCLERQPPGAVTPASLPAWQLLGAQQVASLLLMQVAVREPQVLGFVDRSRSVACWTTARRVPRGVKSGSPVVLEVQARNLLNRPLRRGGERLRLMGEVGEAPQVEDAGKGRYTVRFVAPPRAGDHRLFILLHGQPIAQSPLRYVVRPGPVDLAQTRVRVGFDAVVIGVPFTVQLELRDAVGNRLRTAPSGLAVTCASPPSTVAMPAWGWHGAGTIAVTLRVLPAVPAKTALHIALSLTCESATSTVTLPALPCLDRATFLHVCRVRRGLTLDSGSPTSRQTPHDYPGAVASSAPPQLCALFFRKATRRTARRKLAREAAALAGALGYRYPQSEDMRRLARRSKAVRPKKATRKAAFWAGGGAHGGGASGSSAAGSPTSM